MLGIILSRRDIREYDQLISVYTKEQGKKEFLARGVKKIVSKNSPHLEPFTLGYIDTVQGKELDLLIKIVPAVSYKNIRASLEKSILAGYAVKTIERLVVGTQEDQRIFYLLQSYLDFLETTTVVSETLGYSFLIKLVALLGLQPILDECIHGQEHVLDNQIYFSLSAGGVVCGMCWMLHNTQYHEYFVPINLNELHKLQSLVSNSWEKFNEQIISIKEKRLINDFITIHTENKFKKIFLV
jgi:DNA repair protein RecO (recombination protein O)